MSEEMIIKLITAWRNAKKLSDALEGIFDVSLDYLTDVHGNILDVLRAYAHETGDLEDSKLLQALEENATARSIAFGICAMHNQSMLKYSEQFTQPKPTFFTQEQIDRMQEVFGGYVHDRN